MAKEGVEADDVFFYIKKRNEVKPPYLLIPPLKHEKDYKPSCYFNIGK